MIKLQNKAKNPILPKISLHELFWSSSVTFFYSNRIEIIIAMIFGYWTPLMKDINFTKRVMNLMKI